MNGSEYMRSLKVWDKIKLWWMNFQMKLYKGLAENTDNLTSNYVYVSLPSPEL